MPLYEYRCPECGHDETIKCSADRMREMEYPPCGVCKSTMRRVFSPPTIIVKNPLPSRQGRGKGR